MRETVRVVGERCDARPNMGRTETTAADLHPGQRVAVALYGWWRPGVVVKVNRTTATVRVVANKRGRVSVRREAFHCIGLLS